MAERFLIWYWSPTGAGGSQYAARLADRLARRFGAEAVKLTLHAQDPVLPSASALGVETIAANVVTARRLPVSTAVHLAGGARVLETLARDVDCIILPMNFTAAAPLALTLKKPLVYFAHDPHPHPGDYARVWQRTTQAALLTKSARVVALSNYAAGQLAEFANARGKIQVAPLSAVFEPQAPAPRISGPVRLLLAGRMMAYKGLDILADALPHLAARTDWRLTIAGAGPALDRAITGRFGFAQVDRVSCGWLDQNELESLIANCDILLAPYRSATQSGLIAQAMARGKPCIVTPVGALGEQIGDGAAGWMAQRPDADAFAGAVASALSAPHEIEAKSSGALGLARASWRQDWWRWLEEV